MPLRIDILPSAAEVAGRAADLVRDAVRARPGMVLGLATGRTMVPVYARLAALSHAGALRLRDVSSVNLDEYVGLGSDSPDSFAAFTRRHLVSRTDLDPARVHLPAGVAPDPAAEARRYEALIASFGGVDLQLLGLGGNGHVAFNEPGSAGDTRTRVVELSEDTRRANASDFPTPEAVPRRAITMGIATIRDARALLLLATGAAKAEALAAMLTGPVGAGCPASWLRDHPGLTILCDADAASALPGRAGTG